jgi:hypothetical protein
MRMTIDELIEQYYDDLDGAITGFSGGTDTLDITFEYDESFQGEARIATIRCTDVRECTLHPGGIAELTRPADHPLLWQHVQPHQILAFSSAPPDPFELLGRLYCAHEQLFDGWRAPRDYIHATPEILSGGHGQLAHGPEKAVHAYREIAQRFVQCSVVPQLTPKESCQLILFDEAFVICRDVSLLDSPEKA